MLLFATLVSLTAGAQSMTWQSVNTTTASGTPPNGASPYYSITESVLDASGNIIVVGGFQGTVTFGSTTLQTGNSQAVASFIAKWNPSTSTWMWAYSSGTTNASYFSNLATSGNALYVAGNFTGSTTVAGVTLTSPGYNGLFLAKFIDNGTSLSNGWAVGMSGSFQPAPPVTTLSTCGIAVVGNAVYMAGDFSNDITLQGTTLNSAGSRDVYVAKYIDNGSSVSNGWAIRAGGSEGESPRAMAASSSGIYLTGGFTGTNVFGGTTMISTGGSDIYLVKFADNGSSASVGWALRGGGTQADIAQALAVNGSNVYMGGYITGTDAIIAGTALTTAASTTSVFVAKYLDNGSTSTPQWATSSTANGSSSAQVRGMGLSGSSVFITGLFNTSMTVAGTDLTGSGSSDTYVARFTDNGSSVTGNGALGAGSSASGEVGASVLPSGNTLYNTGTTRSGAVFGSTTVPNNGPAQIGYIAKINVPAAVSSPTITSFSPTSGPAGTVVTINGTNLSGTSSVLLRGIPSRVTPISDTQVSFVVPGQASTGPVRLTTPGGTALSGGSFTVTRTTPTSFTLQSDNFNSIDVGGYSTPTFTDLDSDGLLDMLVGEFDGNLNHYEQSAPNATSFTLVTANFNGIDVGQYSAPTFTDLDGDGLLDMLVGENLGNLNHYEQNAPNATSFTLVSESFNNINVGQYSAPTLTDLDGDGLLDLLVGETDGNLNHYEQDAPNATSFTLVSESFNNIDVGDYSAPTFTDLDGDGLLDLLVGKDGFSLEHYEQSASNAITFNLVTNTFNDIVNADRTLTPTFTDLDGDGFLDLLYGLSIGNLTHYEQTVPLPTATVSGGGTVCQGATAPDVVITLTGGAPYSLTYSNGTTPTVVDEINSNTYTISNPAAGTYTVTAVSNANGTGTASGSANVTINPRPTATVSGGGTVCSGTTPPNVVIALTGGGPYSLTYTNGTTPTTVNNINTSPYVITNPAAGTYTVTAVSNASCTGTASGSSTVTINPRPTATVSGGGTVCAGTTAPSVSIALTGGGPYSLTYTNSTTPTTVNNINTSPYVIANPAAGTYTVTAVSNASCTGTASGSANVTINPRPTATVSGGGTACAGATAPSVSIALTGGGPYSVTYTNGTTPTTVNNINTSPYVIANPAAGTYTVTAVSNASCTGTASGSANVTINPRPTATVSGGGTACAGATAPSVIITLTGGGPYSLTYTNGTTPTTVNNINNSPYYITSPGAGTYTVTAVSNANCTGTASGSANVTINPRPDAPTISASPGNTTTNQPIIVTASGCEGGTISWMISGGTGVAEGNQYTLSQPGNYTIGAKCSVNGCLSNFSNTLYPVINSCPAISAAFNGTTAICNGADTGLSVSLTGGTAPYTVVYADGSGNRTLSSYVSGTSFTVSPATTTTYTLVSVTDANGCIATLAAGTQSATVTVNPVPDAPTLSADPGTTTTNQPITVSASGCSGTVSWNTSGGTDNNDGTYTFSAAGSYSVSATCTVGGCTSPASQTLNLSIGSCALALGTPSVTNLTCFESGDGAIALTATGGAGSLTYTLSPGNGQNATGSFNALSAGAYTVSVSDANNCTATSASIQVTQPEAVPAPTLAADPGNTTTNQSITVSATGCSGTVSWNATGGTDNNDGTYTFSAAGSYSISATCTVGGCVSPASQALNLTINNCSLALNQPTVSNLTCFESGDGAIALNATGGAGSLTYTLSPGNGQNATGSFTGLSAGTYTVSVSDANNCTATSASIQVTQPAAVPAPTLSADPGTTTTNQPITVSASGCAGTVSWNTSGGTDNNDGTYTFSAVGNYTISATCTVEDCTSPASDQLSLSIGSCALALNAPSVTNLSCFESGDGAIALTATGSAGSLTYTLSPGNVQNATGSFNGLSAGSYTVSVSDVNNCTATSGSITINQPDAVPAPTLSADPSTSTTNQPITVTASGCSGTVSWNTTGGTDNGDGTYTFSQPGSYTVSATCTVEGCTSPASQTLNLTINSCTLALDQPSVTNLTCFGSGDGAIALTATGGAGSLTYTLSPGNGQNATGSFTGLSAGTYTVGVSDANSCSATSGAIQVTQPDAVPAPTLSANPGTTTTNQPITISAAGCSGTVSWNATGGTDNNDGTYTFSAAGSYTLSATCTVDGCTSPASQTLNLTINACALALGQPTVTNLTCFESGDGAITIGSTGGSGALTYTLSPGNGQNTTGSFNGLSAGSYTVSVTDANNCTATSGAIQVTQPAAVPAPTLSANPGTTTTNQPVTVSASGCSGTVSWNTTGGTDNNDGTYTFSAAGSYSVSATCTVDGCTSPASEAMMLTINECPTITLHIDSRTDVACFGASTGSFAVTATGGAAPYAYSIGGQSQGNGAFTDLPAGTYSVMVTDANGCTGGTSVTISQPATALSVQASGNTSVIYGYGSSCTTLTANASGGKPGYTYAWNNGTQGPTLNVCPTQTTTYTVTVTDANQCVATRQVTVTVTDVRCGSTGGGILMCANGRETCVAQYLVATYLRFGYQLGPCSTGNTRQAADEPGGADLSLSLTAYPNPTSGQVTVQVQGAVPGQARFELVNAQGRAVQQQAHRLSEGHNEVPIELSAQPAGNYLIRCIDALGRQAVVRVNRQ